MREPERIFQRAQATADLLETFRELRFAFAVGLADLRQFLVFGKILGGGVDAGAGGHDVVSRHTGFGELLQRGGRDIDARLTETAQRKGSRELRVEFVGDVSANLVAVAADARAERGDNTFRLGSPGHHLFDGGTDHTVLQSTATAMRGTDHTGFRIGHKHRQAVGREHAERHVLLRGHLAVGLDHCRLIRGFAHLPSCFALAAGHVETERTVHYEQFVHIDGNAGMHLADQAQFRIDSVGERHTIGEHMVRIIAGFTPEIAVRIVSFAGAAKSRGVHDFDARRKHDRNGHRNWIAIHVGRVDRIAVKNRVIILLVSHFSCFP